VNSYPKFLFHIMRFEKIHKTYFSKYLQSNNYMKHGREKSIPG
jgi:hypothetical protein